MTDKWQEMVGAYVLDALDGEERAAFEARLAGDADLRSAVADAREALTGLAEALPEHPLPPRLRSRLLTEAGRLGREASTGGTTARAATPRGDRGRGGGARRALFWLPLAASLAGLGWLGLRSSRLATEAATLAAELDEARASLAAARASSEAALARFDSLSAALTGDGARFATLTGDAAPSLRLFWNPGRAVLLVAASGLPPAPAGRTFQLWGLRGTEPPVSLGTFDTAADGTALVTLSPQAAEYDLSALTDEPAGGSPQPTTQPFLVGAWSDAGA